MSRPKVTPLERAAKAWSRSSARDLARDAIRSAILYAKVDEHTCRSDARETKNAKLRATYVAEAQDLADTRRALGLVLKLLDAAEAT